MEPARFQLFVRVKGRSKLDEPCVELGRPSKEFWRLQAELLVLLLLSLQPLLIKKELSECFGQAEPVQEEILESI